jgi:hypothetical protein
MARGLLRPHVGWHALALGLLLALYFGNDDMGGDPATPRGDGVYRPVLARGDGHLMWLMLQSLVLGGDLDYAGELDRFGSIWPQPVTATGRQGIVHPIGPALVWAGPFLVAHGGAKVARALGQEIPLHGYTAWHQRFVFTTAPLFAVVAVLLGWWLARRLTGGRWGPLYASLAILLGTSLTAYATFLPWSAHPMDAAATAAFLACWATTVGDLRWRRFAVLGALLGLCALIRVTGFTLALAPALELLVTLTRSRGRAAARLAPRALLLGAVAALMFAPQLVAWKVVHGAWLTSPMGPGFMRPGHPQLAELLFSPRNGWFSTTPLAYAGALGLLVLLADRRHRLVAAGLVSILAAQLYVNASVHDWWGGSAYGARRLTSMTALLVVGLAAWFPLLSRVTRRGPAALRHALAVTVLGWFVAWNLASVHRLRAGRAANAWIRPSCCAELPASMRGLAEPIYRAIGNPFQLPASAIFAWQHGVSPRRWDRIHGAYALEHAWEDVRTGAYRRATAVWRLADPAVRLFLLGGFEVSSTAVTLAARRARILVPLLHDEAHRLTLTLSAGGAPQRVRVRVNGATYAEVALPGRADVVLDVPARGLSVGANVLELEAERPGVEVEQLVIGYP